MGAIAEQDFLRVRLEGERLQIATNLAASEAVRTRVQLEKEMGQTEFPELLLTDPLDANPVDVNKDSLNPLGPQQVLAQRVEVRVALAELEAAQAKEKFATVSARPDLSIEYGYKRTEL